MCDTKIFIILYPDNISSVTVKSLSVDAPLVAFVNGDLVFTAVVTGLTGNEYYMPVTFHWYFGNGDNETSTEPSVTYSYSAPGSWNITLMATNNVSTAVFTGRITVFKGLFLKYMVLGGGVSWY